MTWLLWVLGIGWIATLVGMWKSFERIHALQMNLKDQEIEKAVAQEAAKVMSDSTANMDRRFDDEKLQLAEMIQIKKEEITKLKEEVRHQKGRAQSAHSSKGQILEKWTPFLTHEQIEPQWKPEDWSFMGNPLDYVVWEWYHDKEQNMAQGKIVLLDVKAAKSQLTTKQRRIRDLIKAGKVEWREIRLERLTLGGYADEEE